MENKILKKFMVSLMLVAFSITSATAFEVYDQLEFADSPNSYKKTDSNIKSEPNNKPDIRVEPEVIKLRANVSITDSEEPITLSLRDSDVKQVLRMFADKAGMNVMFDSNVGGSITLDLVNMPLNSAFEMLLNIAQLNYLIENNTLIISSAGSESSFAKQEIALIPVKYVDANTMAQFLNRTIFSMRKPGLSNSEIVSVNPMTNELMVMGNKNDADVARKIVEKFDKKPMTTQNIKINHTTPSTMANLVCKMLIPATSGRSASIGGYMTGAASDIGLDLGGGEVACSTGGGVGISMPFQSLMISYFTQLGTISIIGGSPEQHEMIKEFIAQNDKKQPMAYLELSIIELSEQGSKELTNSWQYISKHFSFNFSDGTSNTNPYMPWFLNGDRYPKFPGEDNPYTPAYYVKKYDGPSSLVYAINYLLENSKGRVLANPRILVTNGQSSTIDLTSDYVKSQTTQVLETSLAGATQRSYDIGSDDGIKITVTPFISPDGYVTLNLAPNYATIASQITTQNPSGPNYPNDINVTLLKRRNLDLKNIRIKDGETLVIGGMINEHETKSLKKIPFLGDLPGIGMIFRSSATLRAKDEMIIMITPRILDESDDVANNL